MSEFTNDLLRYANSPLFKGLVQKSQSNLLTAQTLALHNTVTNLEGEITRLNEKDVMTREEMEKLISKDKDYQESKTSLMENAKAIMKYQADIAERESAYNKAYDKTIQKLAFIGTNEARQMMDVLESNRIKKVKELEKMGALPSEVTKFAELKMKLKFTQEQFEDYHNKKVKDETIEKIEDYIAQNRTFRNMESYVNKRVILGTDKGDNIINNFDKSISAIREDVTNQFKDIEGVTPGMIDSAIKFMIKGEGKDITAIQGTSKPPKPPEPIKLPDGTLLTPVLQRIMLKEAENFSLRWNAMIKENPNSLKVLRAMFYNKDAESLVRTDEEYKRYKDIFEEAKDFIYKQDLFTILYGGNWKHTSVRADDGSKIYFTDNGRFVGSPGTEGIIRVDNLTSLLNGIYEYNPVDDLPVDELRRIFNEQQVKLFFNKPKPAVIDSTNNNTFQSYYNLSVPFPDNLYLKKNLTNKDTTNTGN